MNCDLLRWAASQQLPFALHSVLVTLALHTDDDGVAQISKKQIADRARVTDRQVHTVLERLAAVGLVSISPGVRKGRGRPANAYRLNPGSSVPEADFKKSISRNPIPEASFINSEIEKPASRSQIPQAVENSSAPYISTGARAESVNLNTSTSSECNLHTPEPSGKSDSAFALTPDKPKADKRGTRITADWKPSTETQRMAKQLGIVNGWGQATLENFIDYWLGVPGAKGIKLDWDATYRNELRKEVHAQRHRKPEEGGRAATQARRNSNGPYRSGGVTRLAYTG